MLWQSKVPVNCTNEFRKCLKQQCVIITLNPMVLYILVTLGNLVGKLWIETEIFLYFLVPPRKFRDISMWHNLILTNSSFITETNSLQLCTLKPVYIGRFRFLSKPPRLHKWLAFGKHYEQCESLIVHYHLCKGTIMVHRQVVEF